MKASLLKELQNWFQAQPRVISQEDCIRCWKGQSPTVSTEFLGLRTPTVRSVFKAPLKVNALSFEAAAEVWDHVFHKARFFELRSASLMFFSEPKNIKHAPSLWKNFEGYAEHVDNWIHSDCLSQLVAKCYETLPKAVEPVLRSWNGSEQTWVQRQSLVGLFYYASQRERFPKYSLVENFVKQHLRSEDYYVQKAVGWTLRESHNAYPEKTYDFIRKNVGVLSSYAWSASTEKMSPAAKNELKKLRIGERSTAT